MTSVYIVKDEDSVEPESIVKGYFMRETLKTVNIKLPDGKIICFPKSTINSIYSTNTNKFQDCPTINSDKFIEFCIDIGNSLSKEAGFSIDMLFARLHNIDFSNKEKEIITFLEEKINQGFELFGSLNLLAYIGIDMSVDFLMKYIESPIDNLKQKAFYCIRYIKERQNIDWYHNIEMIDYGIP